jgi:hypothetical protein
MKAGRYICGLIGIWLLLPLNPVDGQDPKGIVAKYLQACCVLP